jgi:probable phosphoglycerate mutase
MDNRQGEADSGRLWPANPSHNDELITAYCDGGSRGNPGPSGFGVFIQGADGETVAELSEYLGKHTNNYAEYSGLLAALDFALTQGHRRMKVVSDSELMVKQIKGQYQVNSPELRPLFEEARRRIIRLDSFQIQHVLREKNQRADRLANLAMDRGTGRKGGENGKAAAAAPEKPLVLRGFVKGGVVHLVEGELPDGVFVRITPERR